MRSLYVSAIFFCIGVGSVALAADEKPNLRFPAERTLSDLKAVLSQLRDRNFTLTTSGPAKPCQRSSADTCLVPVTITETYDKPNGGTPYGCLVSVDDVKVDNTVKYISWTFTQPSNSTADYAFFKANSPADTGRFAILAVEDGDSQFVKTDWISKSQVTAKFKYANATSHVTYYPVITQNFTTSKAVLCGAADPKIVNS